jgi:putative GTP pyrophosphokinase
VTKLEILDQHEQLVPALERIHEGLRETLENLLEARGPKLHSLSGRIKSRSSLDQKLSRPDRDYQHLNELTDLIAFRIIVYSEDVIEEIGHVIEKFFEVDFSRSTNKLHFADAEKFGYRSLHYICGLPSALAEELSTGVPFKFEIQIRTILQHTWAEIEHDLGYKPSSEFPPAFRRRFSQIASLLEIADREFAAIRREIASYQTQLKTAGAEGTEGVELDSLSLASVLDRGEVVRLDAVLSRYLARPVVDDVFFPDYLLRSLQAAGLRTVGDLLAAAGRVGEEKLLAFVRPYFDFARKHWDFGERSVAEVKRGYSLLFVAHMSVLDRESLLIDKMRSLGEFFRRIDGPDDLDRAQAASEALISELQQQNVIS